MHGAKVKIKRPPARAAAQIGGAVTRLQYELLRRGMTQRELAKKAGVNEASISRICNGKEPAFPQRGKRIAEAMGWTGSVADLFEKMEEDAQ